MNTRIQKYAKFFRAIFFFFLIATPLLIGTIWLSGGDLTVDNSEAEFVLDMFLDDVNIDEAHMPSFPLPWSTRLLGLAVSMIPLGVGMLSLWWLVRLFSCFAVGEIFTKNTVMYIRRLGWTMVAGVAAAPIHEALLTIVLTIHNPPGERMVTVSLESTDFEELITAGVIILVSWIMEEGRKLREADELTV